MIALLFSQLSLKEYKGIKMFWKPMDADWQSESAKIVLLKPGKMSTPKVGHQALSHTIFL